MTMVKGVESKTVSDVFRALFNGYCPNDDTLLEKLRTWLETSVNDAGNVRHLLSLNYGMTGGDITDGADWSTSKMQLSASFWSRLLKMSN